MRANSPEGECLIGYSLTHSDCVLVKPLWDRMNNPVTGSAQMLTVADCVLVKPLWDKMNTPVADSASMLTVAGSALTLAIVFPEHVHLLYSSLKLKTSGFLSTFVKKRKGSALMNSMDLYQQRVE